MALRTYGDKPISFQIEEGGEFYCVGSEVMTRFKIWLCASCAVKFMMDLRSRSVITCGCSVGRSTRSTLAWSGGPWPTKKGNVWSTMAWARTFYLALYRYSKRPKLRILSRAMMTSEYSPMLCFGTYPIGFLVSSCYNCLLCRYKAVSVSQELATPRESKSKKPHNPAWLPVMPNSSHLDAVPQATPISRTRVHNKKVKY